MTTVLVLAVQAAAADGPDWTGVINSILGSAVAVVGVLAAFGKWLKGFARTKDIESVMAPLMDKMDKNSGTLDELVSDVRDVRTHQSGLSDRVSSLERRMDGQSMNHFSRWRR